MGTGSWVRKEAQGAEAGGQTAHGCIGCLGWGSCWVRPLEKEGAQEHHRGQGAPMQQSEQVGTGKGPWRGELPGGVALGMQRAGEGKAGRQWEIG